jgi:hypothetical protein
MKIGKASEVVFDAIKNNVEYRRTWSANIAMAFKDNYSQYKKETGKKTLNNEDINIISNRASEHFLNLLCD